MKIGVTRATSINDAPYRIDPSFHLSEGVRVRSNLSRLPYGIKNLGETSEKIFLGNIFTRMFVSDAKHGIPYLAASDTVMEFLETGRYLSKKQAQELSYLILQKGWILVTCSGTLGNVTFTNGLFEGKIATHDLIRVIPDDSCLLRGCLYAFLAGKYGYYQITQSRFGGVVKHINDSQAAAILVPNFPRDFQKSVDDLIKEASSLREDAQKHLDDALALFLSANNLSVDPILLARSERGVQNIWNQNKGEMSINSFKALNYSRRSLQLFQILEARRFVRLSDYLSEPFKMGSRASFKRVGAEYNGVDIVSQGDIHRRNPSVFKKARIKSERANSRVHRSSLIMPSAGTLGENEVFTRPLLVRNNFEDKLLSEVVGVFECKSEKEAAYLYIFLSSKIGFRLLRNMTCGTNLMYPQWAFMKDIPVPICDNKSFETIATHVLQAFDCRGEANKKENLAIKMVEEEIEKWK